jgi:hypothetical protein
MAMEKAMKMLGRLMVIANLCDVSLRVLARRANVPQSSFSNIVRGVAARGFTDREKRVIGRELGFTSEAAVRWLFEPISLPVDLSRPVPGDPGRAELSNRASGRRDNRHEQSSGAKPLGQRDGGHEQR